MKQVGIEKSTNEAKYPSHLGIYQNKNNPNLTFLDLYFN